MPRMRTIDQAAMWLRENDPECAFTKTALRRLVVTGQFPSVRIGTKYLIDLDVLADFLRGSIPETSSAAEGIRRIEA